MADGLKPPRLPWISVTQPWGPGLRLHSLCSTCMLTLRPMSTHCCLSWPLGPPLSMGDHAHMRARSKLPLPTASAVCTPRGTLSLLRAFSSWAVSAQRPGSLSLNRPRMDRVEHPPTSVLSPSSPLDVPSPPALSSRCPFYALAAVCHKWLAPPVVGG